MKRSTISILSALCLGSGAYGAPLSVFKNQAIITGVTDIVANIVINENEINLYPLSTNLVSATNDPYSSTLFETHQTVYFTNTSSGLMLGQPGFDFVDQTATSSKPMASFSDSGVIQSFDLPVSGWTFLAGTPPHLVPPNPAAPGVNETVPSSTLVSAAKINVDGTMQVGDQGLLQFNGQNVQLNGSTLLAGTVDDNPADTGATLDRGSQIGVTVNGSPTIYPFFSPAVDVYDIYWGVLAGSNATIQSLADVAPTPSEIEIPTYPYILGSRNGTLNGDAAEDVFPLSGDTVSINNTVFPAGNFVPSVVVYPTDPSDTPPTNWYALIVLVNNHFPDANITEQVGFLTNGSPDNALIDSDANAFAAMVQFSSQIPDVATGATVTNSIYLIDSGAQQTPDQDSTNVNYPGFAKPLSFEIVRQEPVEWEDWLTEAPGLTVSNFFDTSIVYASGRYLSNTVVMSNSVYAAQVGRNPERPDGVFPFTAALLGSQGFDLPDQTNEGARVEINATKLNVAGMKLRGNGVATINTPSLTGTPAATDFGDFKSALGTASTPLVVSNLFPAQFQRVRGDILAWSATWLNHETNDGAGNKVTNTWHYHMLIVDQDLRDTFTPSAINVNWLGTTMTVDDPVNVIGSAVFRSPSLTLNAPVNMTGNTPTFSSANVPLLKNLLIGPGGSVSADSQINLDVSTTALSVNPSTAPYNIKTITNMGNISSGVVLLQSQTFANGGTVLVTNGGQMVINSRTNLLGAGAGLANSLTADSDINLNSVDIEVANSTIMAGQGGSGQLMIQAAGRLTDFLPNAASTNSYNTNFWQVTDGFSLYSKPASGDLFGTAIRTIVAANRVVSHVWAGRDLGPTVAGFLNNAVIGHLILDRQATNGVLRFSAAGIKNAMYVDYLDLEDLEFSDYHHGLEIDPNFTIYFANANVDPSKLTETYPNIVWVQQFSGPNSTTVVPYLGGGGAMMNAALAASHDIDSDFDGIPNYKDPYPLNNPSPFVGAIPSPSVITSTKLFSVTNGADIQTLAVWTTGQGTIALTNQTVSVGQTLKLTATPAKGSIFLNWSGGVSSTSSNLTFVMPPTNAALVANFETNPFIALAGTYNGLFYQPGVITASSSGAVTFTVTPTASLGTCSGKLRVGTVVYSFSAAFNLAGAANARATNGTNILTISIQVDTTSLTDQATGSVANGAWDAILTADHAPSWSSVNPAPQAGSYTFVLPGNANSSASPGGDSYGTVKVDALGNLTDVGTLADGSGAAVSFSQSVPVSKEGEWPLYSVTTGLPQTLLGWVTFASNGLSGKVNWIRPAGPGSYYTNGFNTSSVLIGDLYVKPTNGSSGLNLTSPVITLTGGNLVAAVEGSVSLSGKLTYETTSKNLSLTVNPATGGFTGQYVAPGSTRKVPLAGVVLPNESVARGFFLGTNQSGSVLLQGQ